MASTELGPSEAEGASFLKLKTQIMLNYKNYLKTLKKLFKNTNKFTYTIKLLTSHLASCYKKGGAGEGANFSPVTGYTVDAVFVAGHQGPGRG